MMSRSELPAEAGTIVVGAGTGGAAAAATLAAHSAESVLVLEAGPDYGGFAAGQWPKEILNAKAIPLSHDWGLTTASASGRVLDLPRARVVGGCSSHNGCTASLGAREDYDDWARQGNPGWEAATVEALLDWTHQRFRVRRYRMDELTIAQQAFVSAGVKAGLPFADDLDNLDAAAGIGPMPVNIVDGIRWNAAFAFLDPVRHSHNLVIAGNSTVRRLLLEHGRAVGVEIGDPSGTPQRIRAERVIIAAGSYHSPALLQRSGVGPATELTALGIDPVIDLPGVGGHLLDHPCVQLDFHGRDGLLDQLAETPWNPDEQTVGRARSSRCDIGPYDIHVFMVAGANSGHPGLPPISLYGGAMRAKSEGRVWLRRAGPDVTPVIEHRYGTDPDKHDRAVLAESLDLLNAMTGDPDLSEILGRPATRDGDPLTGIVSYCHPAGTCKMGPATDPAAVVDPAGAVHGVEGLYVADASVMPSITRGNINLPTAMIGARVASGILKLTPADTVTTAE
jgi:choline dehydrogenase-like flavoprotein